MDILSDIVRNTEHIADYFKKNKRNHGSQCLWCTISKNKHFSKSELMFKPQQMLEYKHPTSSDFKAAEENVVKRALLISTNEEKRYKNHVLEGFSEFLQTSFYFNDIRIVSGEPLNILENFKWLLKDIKPGDYILFLYIDSQKEKSNIASTFIYTELLSKVKQKVHLTVILDGDYSDLDLPITYRSSNGALMLADNRNGEIVGCVVVLIANTGNRNFVKYIVDTIRKKNLRIDMEELLHIMARQIKTEMLTSRGIKPSEYYFCITNR